MDNQDLAFKKMKKILHNIVNTQKNLEPMFDIDFTSMENYPTVQKRLDEICEHLGSKTLFL